MIFTYPLYANSAPTSSPLTPDWSSTAKIEPTGRPNPYGWDEATLAEKIKKGRLHALHYPVEITGILVPARAAMKIMSLEPGDPLFGLMKTLLSLNHDFKNFKGFWNWLGLHPYPENDSDEIPFQNGIRPTSPMGVTLIQRNDPRGRAAQGFTVSCAACHSSVLFGKQILGLTNRFSRANLMFLQGQETLTKVNPNTFAFLFGANAAEKYIYQDSRERIQSIGVKRPTVLGLDTSLAQVALSLSKREQTPMAERSKELEAHPRPNLLDHHVADSKPAVWWNVKYKTHWLSDGSVRSGNPIFTNLLWNEIGRGIDLPEMMSWIEKNSSIVEELTTAVFAAQAPKYVDFFGDQSIHIIRAKRGEALYAQNCAHCHGSYQNHQLHYREQTVTMDVGTDSGRSEGMKALAEALNPLEFSQKHDIKIEEQKGYVPPPLDGIWARYPYLHNNSIPNLCVLMTAPELRPTSYDAGPAINRDRDFDQNCVGYPLGEKTPSSWKKSAEYHFDNRLPGMSNSGHYEGIFRKNGTELYTADQKQDLIEYLKSL